MHRNDIRYLHSINRYPALSILSPTHRLHPANRQDPIRIKNLVNQATTRLRAEFARREIDGLLARLDALVAEINFNYALDGLALFVNDEVARKFYLPFSVRERVVIDHTFMTRDLVYALNRSPRYWVLALSEQPTRLYEGWRDSLVEAGNGDFPMMYEGPGATEPLPGGFGVRKSAYRDERHRQFFRQVEVAFSRIAATEALPLILVGVERNLAFFNEVAIHKHLIAGTLIGNYEGASAHELAKLVWPLMEADMAKQRQEMIKELDAAISAGKYASGIDMAWRLAQEGRGATLLVEENFRYPARLDPADQHLIPTNERTGPEAFDDAVDELIETVLLKGGQAIFIDDGALQAHQGVAMILRY